MVQAEKSSYPKNWGIHPVPEAGNRFFITAVKEVPDDNPTVVLIKCLKALQVPVELDKSGMLHAEGEKAASIACSIINDSEMKMFMSAFEGNFHRSSMVEVGDEESTLDERKINWLQAWSFIKSAEKHDAWAERHGERYAKEPWNKHRELAEKDREEAAKLVPVEKHHILRMDIELLMIFALCGKIGKMEAQRSLQ